MRRLFLALLVVCGLVVYCVGCGSKSSNTSSPQASNAPPPPPQAPAAPEPQPQSEPQPQAEQQPQPEKPQQAEQPPAEQMVEKPAEEMPPEAKTPEGRSTWNLKKLAEAMKAFHEKNGRFPAAATYKDDKPLLSWRVQLLPFLGAEALYKEFHLDEPWDSDHNRTLLSRIPEVYQTPGGPGEGKTCYLVAAGLGTMFGQREGISKTLIADGPDKTIMIVEADADRAVPWTQPQDLQYIPASPGAGLGAMRDKAFLSVFADGVTHKIATDIGADALRGLFTYNGREILDLAAIEGKPGAGGEPARRPSEGFVAQAEQFFAQGDHKRGLLYLMADGVIRGHEDVMNSIRWCPGLKRPVLMLRFGMLIQTAQATGAQAVAAAAAGGVNPLHQEAVAFWTQAVGLPMLSKLQSRVNEGSFGKWMRQGPAQLAAGDPAQAGSQGGVAPRNAFAAENLEGRRVGGGGAMPVVGLPDVGGGQMADVAQAQAAGIVNLGMGEVGAGRRNASKESVDVMIIAAVTAKIVRVRGNAQVQSTLTLRVIDVLRNETLWTSKPLSSSGAEKDQAAAEGPTTQAPPFARGLLRELFDYMDENLALVDMPPLTPEVVRERGASLAAAQYVNPLPTLLELRYYEFKKLLKPEEISTLFAKIVGADEGPRLATGPIEQRKEIVQRWLGGG
jgi:hypothetical protein